MRELLAMSPPDPTMRELQATVDEVRDRYRMREGFLRASQVGGRIDVEIDYLVDGTGLTLYLFTKDEGTTTACTGGCAENWPPIIAEGDPTGGDGIDAALLGTADGIEPNQVTYNGHLLYYFHEDTAPGDTNGVGLPDWFAVDPAGEAIEAG